MIAEKKKIDPHWIGWPFWALFAVNYAIMGLNRYVSIPIPLSLCVELFYFLALIHVGASKYGGTANKVLGPLFGLYSVWCVYAVLEITNTSAGIPYGTIAYRWFAEVRTIAFQALYGFFIFAGIFNTRQKIRKFHRVLGICVIAAVAKCLMQQYVGFDAAENAFLATARKTHFVNGIIRYFSFFSEAANFGSSMAASTVVFTALGLTAKNKMDKIYFAICAVVALYGMMASGTRSAILALAAGLVVYAALSKNFKAIVATAVVGCLTVGFLMFTEIGQGNSMIRRMRSAFNKDDASLATREVNKKAMERYLAEVPMGIGAGIQNGDIPPSNKNHFLSVIAPDSTWVYVHIRYGIIGECCFLFSFFGIIIYGSYVVLTKIKQREVVGQMAATVSGCASMFIAGYSNAIMMQFPNCLIFFGSMGMLVVAVIVDEKALKEQEEETLKMLQEEQEKMLNSRVTV
ncbi:MAG: O-antigen ligase family protein [Bacteroidaceae bacterium]|nr:O-antigen ligase family protein [Bacteroidaceae bacterium]